MRKYTWLIVVIIVVILLGLTILPNNTLFKINWALLSALIISLAIIAFCIRFEEKSVSSKEITLTATMATLAAVSRVPFAMIMSIQPTTFIVMITGYVFGTQTGFMVGALAALVSNIFLGQGPWTPWQMFSWGLGGVLAGILGRNNKGFNKIGFTVLVAIWGYIFGWIMNLWHWVGFVYPLTLKTFLATYLASLPFDTIHALGNIIFALIFGKTFYLILLRFKNKITILKFN